MLLPVSSLAVSNSLILVNCKKCILDFTDTFNSWFCNLLLWNMLSFIHSFIHSFSRSRPLSGHASKGRFNTRKPRDGANTTLTINFFTWLKEKNIYALNNWNNHFYSNDSKSFHTMQTTISFIHSKMIETCYEDTTQTTTFWILAETFYIPSTFYNFNNQFLGWKWKF